MHVLLRLVLATLAAIVSINTWLIIRVLRAALRAATPRAPVPASPAVSCDAHRVAGGRGGAWVEAHSTQKSMNVRILRDRYLRLT
jgi:hypothetical protein